MKNFVILLLLFTSSILFGQKTEILKAPQVDHRIELLSLTFRLAEIREYSSKRFPFYVERIEAHFADYKQHELIDYIRKIRKSGIGYDAVMAMAISLTDTYPFQGIQPFSKDMPDPRWGKKKATKFLALLNSFYVDANCAQFFKENQVLYDEASNLFNRVFAELDINWYQEFYGQKPKGEFRIVNGLGNGGGNYGPKVIIDGKETIYAIMGTWKVDDRGMPDYPVAAYFPTLVHEFNHSFVNHVVEKYHSQLSNSGQKIFKPLKDRMAAQAYGSWQTMYAEALVRAAVIKYLQDQNYQTDFVQTELTEEINRGFLWTKELVAELDRYSQNRDQYPDLESFMPEVIKFFNSTAANITAIKNDVDNRRPQIVAIKPFENGSQKVPSSTKQIEIVFDKPLAAEGYSIHYGKKGEKVFPEIGDISYSEDKKTVLIELSLKPNQDYQFVMSGRRFKTKEGYGMNDFEIHFKTSKE